MEHGTRGVRYVCVWRAGRLSTSCGLAMAASHLCAPQPRSSAVVEPKHAMACPTHGRAPHLLRPPVLRIYYISPPRKGFLAFIDRVA